MRSIEVRYIVRRESSSVDVLGVDISKADFHACLIQGDKRTKKSFPNAPPGYRQMRSWLKNRQCAEVHACMEATGSYWEALAKALYDAGSMVSVVNPSQTVFFARSQLRRTKTDAVDAEMIAEFCQQRHPSAWTPPPEEILELRGLLSYREHLVREIVALKQMAEQIHVSKELGKLHLQQLKAFEKSQRVIERQLQAVVKAHPRIAEQVQALTAISGIGLLTALSLVAKLPAERLRNDKAAAAYVGLAPSERQSGTSVHGKPRYNPILKAFAERLKERGKPSKVIITAVMRKLVVLAFRILHGLPQPAMSAT